MGNSFFIMLILELNVHEPSETVYCQWMFVSVVQPLLSLNIVLGYKQSEI